MNLTDKVQLDRLFRRVEYSRRQLRPFREDRLELIRQHAGSRFGNDNNKKEVLVNLMHQTAETYSMSLTAQRPRVMVSTKKPELRPFAINYQCAINNLIQEIALENTLRTAVLDAFFSIGIVKVSRGDSVVVELEGYPLIDPGFPFAESVSLDNWVHDVGADQWWKINFAADTYRIPFEAIETDERFDKSVVNLLKPTTKYATNPEGDERAERIAQGWEVDQDEYEPMGDLMDVWLPKEQVIATFACDSYGSFNSQHKPLAVVDWEGPEEGPYHILSFSDVPDNLMPSSPAARLSALHLLTNALLRKLAKQARNQKTIVTFTPGAEDDATRASKAVDMQLVKVKRKDDLGIMHFNGADPGNQAFSQFVRQLFNGEAGNLDAWAGLGPQSSTVGQDQMIHAQVSKKEAKMQYRVVDFAAKVCRSLGWQLWDDEMIQLPGTVEIPGANLSMQAPWQAGKRDGNFLDYNFDVAPYSMAYQSPTEQLAGLNEAVQLFLQLAATPWGQQKGMGFEVDKLATAWAELKNIPLIAEIITFNGVPPKEPGELDQGNYRQPLTRRENVRRSIPGGQSVEMMQQELMTRARQQGPQMVQ